MKKLFILITLLSTIFSACSNSDEATPTFSGCLVKTVQTKSGPLMDEIVFNYSDQGNLNQITNGFLLINFVHEPNKVTMPGFSNLSKDELFLDNGKWVRSLQTYGSVFNGVLLNSYDAITPTYTGNLVSQIKNIRSEETLVNGIKTVKVRDSVVISLTYDNLGKLITLTDDSPGFNVTYTFEYPSDLVAAQSNSYLNNYLIGQLRIEGLTLAALTGNFKLFKVLPSQINTIGSPGSTLKLFEVQSDGSKNVTRLIADPEDNFGIGQSDTISLTYECR